MKPKDLVLAQTLSGGLQTFSQNIRPLPGIHNQENREVLVEQLIESLHRIKYIKLIAERDISNQRADPTSDLFDPQKAAILHLRNGHIDEAFWLIFLSVHFGKNNRGGWRYARETYDGFNHGRWTWAEISSNIDDFKAWFEGSLAVLGRPGGGFGNHRKYESLGRTGIVVESYVSWIGPHQSHQAKIHGSIAIAGDNPKELFAYLYKDMSCVKQFGRTGKFDYLTMIGNLGLAPIAPDSTYMTGATGPLDGARLLFSGNKISNLSYSILDTWLKELDQGLNVGMQVIEDALCNWQKSPAIFKPFRG